MGLLFVEFLWLLPYWSQRVYGTTAVFKSYGLEWTRQNAREYLQGISIGLVFCWALFLVEALLGWILLKQPSVVILRIIIEGLISAMAIGFAEELLFRGWILDELQRDYKRHIVLWSNGLIFATLHFLKPLPEIMRTWPQFPALVILGVILVKCKWSCDGRLGLNSGLHTGLVWAYYIVNVGQLIRYRDNVSPWVTGVDGNPLAGLMGLLFLGFLGFLIFKRDRANWTLTS